MVHELISIQDNKVDLRSFGKIPKDQQVYFLPFHYATYNGNITCVVLTTFRQEVVLSSEQDAFFKANMHENFGDIGISIKTMVDEFQQLARSNQNIQTIGLYKVT